ncbi:MAG: YbaN family protein [Candidatus Lokiarchaeota archaeon]|nr:YbaN family protein [Candidatus Lokiarchaeota archaeon]
MNKSLEKKPRAKESENVKKKIITRLVFLGGFISLILGIIGIAIPILPTTPFLLLASAAFAKSSERFNRWLLNNKILGAYIKNYREGKGLPLKIKLITLSLLWITILVSMLFLMNLLWVQILLICIAIAVSLHIILIKPKNIEKNQL